MGTCLLKKTQVLYILYVHGTDIGCVYLPCAMYVGLQDDKLRSLDGAIGLPCVP